jgi:hypothetical protein
MPAPTPPLPTALGLDYLAGFGQVWTQLNAHDIVTLQLMLASSSTYTSLSSQILYIGPTNISYPTPSKNPTGGTGIARGPTLTIMKIADPN